MRRLALALCLLVPTAALAQPTAADCALQSTEIFEIVDEPPQLIGGIEGLMGRIVYPDAARRAGVEGRVLVQFVVDEEGRVTDPTVARSPDSLLSVAALDAVRASSFTAGRDDGRPVKVRFAVPITFRLTEPPAPAPEVYELMRVEELPELIGGLEGLQRRLDYPEAVRRDRIEGQVVIEFVVDEEGRVREPRVVRSPDWRLSHAALDALRGSRFTPARLDGHPVKVQFSLPVSFRLGSGMPRRF